MVTLASPPPNKVTTLACIHMPGQLLSDSNHHSATAPFPSLICHTPAFCRCLTLDSLGAIFPSLHCPVTRLAVHP